MKNPDLHSTLNLVREKFDFLGNPLNDESTQSIKINNKMEDDNAGYDYDEVKIRYKSNDFYQNSSIYNASQNEESRFPESLIIGKKYGIKPEQETIAHIQKDNIHLDEISLDSQDHLEKNSRMSNKDLSSNVTIPKPYSPKYESIRDPILNEGHDNINSIENKMLSIHKSIIQKSISQLDKINAKAIENDIIDSNKFRDQDFTIYNQGINEKEGNKSRFDTIYPKKYLIYIVGEIEGAQGFFTKNGLFCEVSYIIPEDWDIILPQDFETKQQTMTSYSEESGYYSWNHPLDILFQSNDIDNWPLCSLNIWNFDEYGTIALISRGTFQFPRTSGFHKVICKTWTNFKRIKEATKSHFINKWPVINRNTISSETKILKQPRREPSGIISLVLDVIINNNSDIL